jgi:DNA-directed RNA polymerase specialized sigma subunit
MTRREVIIAIKTAVLYKHAIDPDAEDRERELAYVQRVHGAINSLPLIQQLVICARYFEPDADYLTDVEVIDRIGVSSMFFRQTREKALENLSKSLSAANEIE